MTTMLNVDHERTLLARVVAASDNVDDLRAAAEAATEMRDTNIVEAVEAGYTNREVARAAHLSEARIIAILART